MITKATVKYIQSLQYKKFRDECNVFIAEGPKVIGELLLQNIFHCEALYFTKKGEEILHTNKIFYDTSKAHLIEEFELQKISTLVIANGMLAIFTKAANAEMLDITTKIVLMLDGVQDPGNLGTIIRTADWFGITTIFCSTDTADCYNPKVVQSTMASLGRVNMIYTDLKIVLENNSAVKKYAAVLNGIDVATVGKIMAGIIIIGSEGNGISAPILKYSTEAITIKRVGIAESLNAGVATGIILHSLC